MPRLRKRTASPCGRFSRQAVEAQAERRGQLVEQVAAQVGQGVAAALRRAVGVRQDVDVVEGRAFVGQARAVHAVLGGERDAGVGEVVQLGERGVDVGLLGAGRGRVVRGAAEHQGRDRRLGLVHLLEQPAQGEAEVGQAAAGAAAGRGR